MPRRDLLGTAIDLARTFVANPQPTIGSAKALLARCDVVHVFNIHVDMLLIFI